MIADLPANARLGAGLARGSAPDLPVAQQRALSWDHHWVYVYGSSGKILMLNTGRVRDHQVA
jgi:hypothetical protein